MRTRSPNVTRKRKDYSMPEPLPAALDEHGDPVPTDGWINGVREMDAYLLWSTMHGAKRSHVMENLSAMTGVPVGELKAWRERHHWDQRLEEIHVSVDDIVTAKTAIMVTRASDIIADLAINAENEAVRLRAAMEIRRQHDQMVGRSLGKPTVNVDKMLIANVRAELDAADAPRKIEQAATQALQAQLDRTNLARTTKQTALPALSRSGRT